MSIYIDELNGLSQNPKFHLPKTYFFKKMRKIISAWFPLLRTVPSMGLTIGVKPFD